MKITESTSISLKLLIPLLLFSSGLGTQLFQMNSMIAAQGRDIRIIKQVVKKIAPAVIPNIIVPGLIGDAEPKNDNKKEPLGKI